MELEQNLQKLKKHPFLYGILICFAGGGFWAVVEDQSSFAIGNLLFTMLLGGLIFGSFIIMPFLLTLVNVTSLFHFTRDEKWRKTCIRLERFTVIVGAFYSVLLLGLSDITTADWDKVLINNEKHSPLWSGGRETLAVFAVLAVAGYVVLSSVRIYRLSPLVIVLSIAAMYIGIALCVVWCIQIFGASGGDSAVPYDWWENLLCLAPFNCIIIALKTIRYKIKEWNEENEERDFSGRNRILSILNQMLAKSERWPFAALIVMLPLLGIGIGILVLTGQEPDAIVKAWTETAEWRLSAKEAPPNVYEDMHYLCTVAAGGHRQVVKPLRMGERHGHRVVVNRQLCIANAFEQILEERTPGFHRAVRHFYDTYGFPVAKLIHSRLAADAVYVLMKPLEWMFLAAIYLCDTKPENRIAAQYLPKRSEGGE